MSFEEIRSMYRQNRKPGLEIPTGKTEKESIEAVMDYDIKSAKESGDPQYGADAWSMRQVWDTIGGKTNKDLDKLLDAYETDFEKYVKALGIISQVGSEYDVDALEYVPESYFMKKPMPIEAHPAYIESSGLNPGINEVNSKLFERQGQASYEGMSGF